MRKSYWYNAKTNEYKVYDGDPVRSPFGAGWTKVKRGTGDELLAQRALGEPLVVARGGTYTPIWRAQAADGKFIYAKSRGSVPPGKGFFGDDRDKEFDWTRVSDPEEYARAFQSIAAEPAAQITNAEDTVIASTPAGRVITDDLAQQELAPETAGIPSLPPSITDMQSSTPAITPDVQSLDEFGAQFNLPLGTHALSDMSNRFSAARRQGGIRNDLARDASISTARTPETQRTERFQRLADELNNRTYYRPGATFHSTTGPMQGQTSQIYDQRAVEFEDMRQQMINRARRGDMLAYQELRRLTDVNNIMNAIRQGQELDANALERLRNFNEQELLQQFNQNELALYNAVRQISVERMQAMMLANVQDEVLARRLDAAMGIMRENPGAAGFAMATAYMNAQGYNLPGLIALVLGGTATTFNNNILDAFSARAPVATTNEVPAIRNE